MNYSKTSSLTRPRPATDCLASRGTLHSGRRRPSRARRLRDRRSRRHGSDRGRDGSEVHDRGGAAHPVAWHEGRQRSRFEGRARRREVVASVCAVARSTLGSRGRARPREQGCARVTEGPLVGGAARTSDALAKAGRGRERLPIARRGQLPTAVRSWCHARADFPGPTTRFAVHDLWRRGREAPIELPLVGGPVHA